MICSNCEIWEENERLRARISELQEQIAQRDEQIVQLKMRNEKLRRCLELREEVHLNTKQKPLRRRREITVSRFPGRPSGHPGTTRPFPQPEIFIDAEEQDNCPICGLPLGDPIHNKERIIEELPDYQTLRVVAYKELHYFCSNCESEIISRHEDCPPMGRFGKNVYVQTVLEKFVERVPIEKIGGVFERSGLTVSPATTLELLSRSTGWLRPEYEMILAEVRRSHVVYLDQTGIGVDGANFWIWVFVTDSEIFYVIRGTKSQKVLEEILGKGWSGTLVFDGLRSHHSFARKSGAKVQRCWAKLLNESKKLAEKCAGAKSLNEGLHRIFDRLKKALEKEPPPEERERLARNARRAMRRLMNKDYKNVTVQKLIEKIRRGYPYWFTFVTTPGVEPTNNRAERALRELVIQRKIIGTLRNEKGMRIYETLPTLLATWKQRGLCLPEILSTSLTRAWKRTTIVKKSSPIS